MLISGEASDLERRVERGGLARAGRAGDEDDAVRALDPVVERLQLVLVEAEAGEVAAAAPRDRRCA